jgi:hypothetical protein
MRIPRPWKLAELTTRIPPHRRDLALWAVAFTGYFLAIAGWALAAPYNASSDEHEHVYRAAGVAVGEFAPTPSNVVRGGGASQTVPAGLVRHLDACWQFNPVASAACATPPNGDDTPVRVGSGAGRYFPAYYAAVGLPLAYLPGWGGLYLARLIGGAMGAALLAGALVAVVRHSRHRLMLGGLLVAVTPTAMQFLSAVNPNGLEIAAGVGFFAAIIPLTLGEFDRVPTGLVTLAGSSAVALAVLRPTGLLFLATASVAFLLPLRKAVLLRLRDSTAMRWWTGAALLAAVAATVWTIVMRSAEFGPYFAPADPYSRGQAVLDVFNRLGGWLDQAVAIFNWLALRVPQPVYVFWEVAAGTLVVLALAFGGWVERWRLFVVFAGAVLLPAALQVWYVNENGFITQGRYLLPILAGLVLLAAFVLDENGFPERAAPSLVRLILLVVLPIQAFCLVFMMARWQHGLPDYGKLGPSSLNPFTGEWHPPVGSALSLFLALAGFGLLGVIAWFAARSRDEPAGTGSGLVYARRMSEHSEVYQ